MGVEIGKVKMEVGLKSGKKESRKRSGNLKKEKWKWKLEEKEAKIKVGVEIYKK